MSQSTPAPALAAASKAVGKAPAKTPAAAQSGEAAAGADPSAAGADVGSVPTAAGAAAAMSEKNQTAKSKLGGAAEASQARRVKAVQAAAKAQVLLALSISLVFFSSLHHY